MGEVPPNQGVAHDPGDIRDDYVYVPSQSMSESSYQTESMGRDAVMECAGVTSPVPAEGGQDPLYMEGQRRLRLRENAEFSEPSATVNWILQAEAAMKMAPCDVCDVIEKSYPDHDSIEFWRSIEESSDSRTRCHKKFYRRMVQRFREAFPDEPALRNTRTMNFLKMLLHIEGTDDTVEVFFDKFVRVLKFFGPVKLSGSRCVLLQQLQLMIDKSLKYNSNGKKKEKISWFAGDMSREEAENRLSPEQEGTYLVRMSQNNADHGDFALSVKQNEVVYHIEIKGQPLKASTKEPFSSCLVFQAKEHPSLVELVEELKYGPVTVADDEEEEGTEIWCQRICPGLPLNGVISGYKRTKANTKGGTCVKSE